MAPQDRGDAATADLCRCPCRAGCGRPVPPGDPHVVISGARRGRSAPRVYVKHENVQPVGAFKVRGGLALLAGMTAAERARGLVTYSTGNHAQSIAYACALFDTPCTVVMPAAAADGEGSCGTRTRRHRGPARRRHGGRPGTRRAHGRPPRAGTWSVRAIRRPCSPVSVPRIWRSSAAQPDLDMVVVPVGSGTGAAAATVAAAKLAPGCRVIAVQSSAAPAAHDSWRAGRLRPAGPSTPGRRARDRARASSYRRR